MVQRSKNPQTYKPRPYRPLLASAIRPAEALQTLGVANYVYEIETDEIIWGEGARELLGDYFVDNVKNAEALQAHKNEGSSSWRTMMTQKIDSPIGGNIYLERYYLDKDSDQYLSRWVEDTGYWHENEAGDPIRAEGALRMICENIGLVETSQSLMYFDPITKCLNEHGLMQALHEAIEEAKNDAISSAFVQMEIDGLGRANMNLGMRGGDELLREAAHAIASSMRQGDVIGRLPGARFGIILRQCTADDLKTALSRFLNELRGRIFKVADAYAVCDARVGGVFIPTHAQNPQQAMARSLDALLMYGTQTQNDIILYNPANAQEHIRKRAAKYAGRLVQGLQKNKLSLALQPVINDKGQILFQEGLMRLLIEQDAMVDASVFINIAEKYGLCRFIDLRALKLALDHLRIHDQIPLSLNVSSQTITDKAWHLCLTKDLKSSPTLAKKLIFELPFQFIRHQPNICAHFCTEMHKLGCQIALDNIDINICAPNLLKILQPEFVKLDSAKIAAMMDDNFTYLTDENQMQVDRLMELVEVNRAQLVVTRLEDPEFADLLAGYGLQLQQGKAVGLPISIRSKDSGYNTEAA